MTRRILLVGLRQVLTVLLALAGVLVSQNPNRGNACELVAPDLHGSRY